MRKVPAVPKAPILALFMLSAVSAALATDVDKSTEYPVPSGIYDGITVSRYLRMGIPTAAVPDVDAHTPNAGTANPATASQAALTINGNVYIHPLDLNLTDAQPPVPYVPLDTDGGAGATVPLRDVVIDEKLTVDGTTFRVVPLNWWGNSHWTAVNVPGAVTGDSRGSEFQVNGDIHAYAYRASQRYPDQNDTRVHFGPTKVSGVSWLDMRAKTGMIDANQWAHGMSTLYFRADPMLVLNGYSRANVGIGTTNPTYLLQVGDPGSGLQAIAHSWDIYSSRAYKTDIRPFSPADYRLAADRVGDLNLVRFRYKEDKPGDKKILGFIAEEAPNEILSPDGKAVSLGDTLGFLLAAIKGLKAENDALRTEIERLETAGGRLL